MKKITAFLLTGIISVCFSQENWIYYNTYSSEDDFFTIRRVNQNGENDTLIFDIGYLLDISEDGNYMLLTNLDGVKRYNSLTGALDDISTNISFSGKFASNPSKIIYATQRELLFYDIDNQENITISDSLSFSYETNFDYSPDYNSIVFYEQSEYENNIVIYNLSNDEKIVLSNNAMPLGDGWSYLSWSLSNYIYYQCAEILNDTLTYPQICRVFYEDNNQPEQITEEYTFFLAPIANYSGQEKVIITEIDEEFGGSILHLYDSSTDELYSLIPLEGAWVTSKIWSKDNNSIIFSTFSDDYELQDIWIYNILDSTLVDVANGMNPIFYQNEELNITNNILKKFEITNYPNPFNPVTTLRYDLSEDANVNITIYDMMGRVVSNLVSSQQRAGYKSVQWNATNNTGQPVSAGIYLYSIEAGQFRQTKKMVLLK